MLEFLKKMRIVALKLLELIHSYHQIYQYTVSRFCLFVKIDFLGACIQYTTYIIYYLFPYLILFLVFLCTVVWGDTRVWVTCFDSLTEWYLSFSGNASMKLCILEYVFNLRHFLFFHLIYVSYLFVYKTKLFGTCSERIQYTTSLFIIYYFTLCR